jgi:F-type H+-transporting ATPase subunit b
MELLKLLSTNEIVAQVLGFLLLLFLLRILAWKKFLKILDQRKERIASEFKQIEDAKQEIAKIKAEYDDRMLKIEETAKAKIQEAVDQGKQITEEIRKQAYRDAQGIIDKAAKDIKYEISKAKEELKKSIVDLTIRATENMIQEKLTDDQDKRLVKDFLEKIEEIE